MRSVTWNLSHGKVYMRSIHPCNHFRMENLILTRAVRPAAQAGEYWKPSKSNVLIFLTPVYYYGLVAETSICICLFACFFLTVSSNCFKHFQPLPAEHTFCAGTAWLHTKWRALPATYRAGWLREYFELTHRLILKGGGKRICAGRARRYCSLPYNLKIQMKCTVIPKVGLTSYMGPTFTTNK